MANTRGAICKQKLIEKHRILELRQFCLQYHFWKRRLNDINYYGEVAQECLLGSPEFSNRTLSTVLERERYTKNVDLIDSITKKLKYGEYVLQGITNELTYDQMQAWHGTLPCSRKEYYKERRQFFFMLDRMRD